MQPRAPHLERSLEQHARCVRGLAAALLDDAAAADDVAQDALLQAWRQPPREPGALRAFLFEVTRNLARRWRRTRVRRDQRERLAARPEPLRDAAHEVERAELVQAIGTEVAALPSDLREVVLLRHYESLPPRRIAARLGVAAATVEARLRRAHRQLGARLQARWRSRSLAPVLAAFALPDRAVASLLGTLAMTTKSKLVPFAAALFLFLIGFAYWTFGGAPPTSAPAAGALAAAGEPDEGRAAPQPTHRKPLPALATPLASAPEDATGTWSARIRGRVVDEQRRAVAGADVVVQTCSGRRAAARADGEGRFTVALAAEAGASCQGEVAALHGERCGTATFFGAQDRADVDVGTIALEPAGSLEVTVQRDGAPESGARVVARRALWAAGVRWEALTDPDGEALLERVGTGRVCVGVAAADGSFAAQIVDVVGGQRTPLAVDLRGCVPVHVDVRARVDGAPIAGASILAWLPVHLEGGQMARVPLHELLPLPRSDGAGHAALPGLLCAAPVQVGAEHPDWLPASTETTFPTSAHAAELAAHVELRLERLVTASWRLVAAEVDVPPDGTRFRLGPIAGPPIHEATLHAGVLELPPRVPFGGLMFAWGPGCVAHLPWPDPDDRRPADAHLRRPRRLVVDVRDATSQPIAGLAIAFTAGPSLPSVRTGPDGRAVVEGLAVADGAGAALVVATIDSSITRQELGRADLARGDGHIAAELGLARRIRARVLIDGRPALPGKLDLCSSNGAVTDVEEDAERGVLTCRYWQHRPSDPAELRLYGSWRQSIGVAVLPPGNGPADVQFELHHHAAATIVLQPPADGLCQVLVERAYGPGQFAVWTHVQPGAGNRLPRLTNLRPGRYRLRDGLSDVTGPELDVVTDAPDAVLALDLATVVGVGGRVVGSTEELRGVAVLVRDGAGRVVRRVPVANDGSFTLRVALGASELTLAAVGEGRSSAALPITSAARDLTLALPLR